MTTPVFDGDEAERAKNGCQCDILHPMTHPSDDPLREALEALPRWEPDYIGWRDDRSQMVVEPEGAYLEREAVLAALAAAPQPAPAPADERAEMIEVLRKADYDWWNKDARAGTVFHAQADALLAKGYRRGRGGAAGGG